MATMYIAEAYAKAAQMFNQFYRLSIVLECPKQKPSTPTNESQICRFCGKGSPEVSFNSDAHVFPEALGNHTLVSDFECDKCNNIFSDCESHLVNYLGPRIQMFGLKGKKSSTTYPTADKNVKFHHTSINNKPVTIIAQKDVDQENISADRDTGINAIQYEKRSYVPTKVYKALLKIALCALPQEDSGTYAKAYDWLLNNTNNEAMEKAQHVFYHQLHTNHVFTIPKGFLYKKTVDFAQLPTHTFIIYVADLVFEIYLPFNNNDEMPGKGKAIVYPIYPSIMLETLLSGKPIRQKDFEPPTIELNSDKKVKASKEAWVTSTDPKHFKNLVSFDPETGVSTPGQMSETAAMIMARNDIQFTNEELIQLTRIVKSLRGVKN